MRFLSRTPIVFFCTYLFAFSVYAIDPLQSPSPSPVEAKPDQWVVNTAALLEAGWKWALIVIGITAIGSILIWKRKQFSGLLDRFLTNTTDINALGVAFSAPIDSTKENPETRSSDSEPEQTEPVPNDNTGDSPETDTKLNDEDTNPISRLIAISRDSRDLDQMATVYSEMENEAKPEQVPDETKTLYLFIRFKAGDRGALKELQQLATSSEQKSQVLPWLMRAYEAIGKYSEAIKAGEAAVDASIDDEEKANSIIRLSNLHKRVTSVVAAEDTLLHAISKNTSHPMLAILYKGLADLFDELGDREKRALALEKAVEYAEDSSSLLFALAYAHDQNGMSQLSYRAYRDLVAVDESNSSAWNNLGVLFTKLKLPFASVAAYRSAERHGNTLSSANLANKLIDAGFSNEAKSIIDEAKKSENIHGNVIEARDRLAEELEAEEKKKRETGAQGIRQRNFMRQYAESRFSMHELSSDVLLGSWEFHFDKDTRDGEGTISISQDFLGDPEIIGKWCYEIYQIKIEIQNKALKITERDSVKSSVSEEFNWRDSNRYGYGYLSDDKNRIFVMMKEVSDNQFFEISRVPENLTEVDKNN